MTIASVKKKKKLNYLREVQKELSKVTWTSKEELFVCTKVVIISTFVFGLGIFAVDMVIRNALSLLNYLARFIGG